LISPVPGGVGPMTVTMLLYNTRRSAERSVGVQIDDEDLG
jgi:methylenetetrahydrofolate dehydrogenase (NADP+) / methenyltetrahydrofolate cyclohydrolase